jgi:hypothetical protein
MRRFSGKKHLLQCNIVIFLLKLCTEHAVNTKNVPHLGSSVRDHFIHCLAVLYYAVMNRTVLSSNILQYTCTNSNEMCCTVMFCTEM